MGISAPAAKQRPFTAWVRGTRACRAAIHMPGQRGADKHAAKCAKLPWALPVATLRDLDRLAED
eukprot:7031815-Lingulodinium_polyedra.AAC.1